MPPRITMRSGRLRTAHQVMLEHSKKNITSVAKMANDPPAMSTYPKKTSAKNIDDPSQEFAKTAPAGKLTALRCYGGGYVADVAVGHRLHRSFESIIRHGCHPASRCCCELRGG